MYVTGMFSQYEECPKCGEDFSLKVYYIDGHNDVPNEADYEQCESCSYFKKY